MGLLGSARRVALTARYVASAGEDGGEIRLVPGDPAVTDRLEQILRVTRTAQPPEGALAVFSIAPGEDAGEVAARIAERSRRRERSMALLIGRNEHRADAERALLATGEIEMSRIAHVPALDAEGRKEVLTGVLRALPHDEVVAAARRNPELRDTVVARLRSANARTAGVLAGGLLGSGAGMVGLIYLQVKMLGDIAGARGRNLGREDLADVAAVAGSGVAWRMVGRRAVRLTGRPTLARGAVAWAATRGIGMAADRRLRTDGPAIAIDDLKGAATAIAARAKSLRGGEGN